MREILESGGIVVLKEPVLGQDRNAIIAEDEELTYDRVSSVEWLLLGTIGSPK
jgi:hypothetical protein